MTIPIQMFKHLMHTYLCIEKKDKVEKKEEQQEEPTWSSSYKGPDSK